MSHACRPRRSTHLLALTAAVGLLAAGLAAGGAPARAGAGGPIRIGVLLPYSGVYAPLGENITLGMRLYLDSIGNEVAGRRIELKTEDTQGNPQQGLPKARQLVTRDQVHLLAGVVHSGVAEAIRDYVHNNHIPLVIANAGAAGLTRDPQRRSPYIFRTSFANGQYEYILGPYAYQQLGYRTVAILAPDYSAGHEKADAFKMSFQRAGGQVVNEVYPPLGTNDYAPYLQRLQRVPADAVWAFVSGTDAIRFVQQYGLSGLKQRTPLIGAGDMVDEAWLQEIGDAALGVVTSLHYSPLLDTPENRAFVQAFRSRYGRIPNQFAYQGYITARVIAEAIAAIGGDVENTERLVQALRGVRFVGPAGPFRFDPETQNVVFTVYVRRVERLADGSLGNVVIASYPDVSDRF